MPRLSKRSGQICHAPQLRPAAPPAGRETAGGATPGSRSSPLNRIEKGRTGRGIICSGVAYQYVKEALPEEPVLKLGFSYSLPEKLILSFAATVEELIIVEELDPFLEEQIRALQPGVPVRGKQLFPRAGELGVKMIRQKLCGSEDTVKERPSPSSPGAAFAPAALMPGLSTPWRLLRIAQAEGQRARRYRLLHSGCAAAAGGARYLYLHGLPASV